jgi:hypothetical protein
MWVLVSEKEEIVAKKAGAKLSIDDQLGELLQTAETALIGAVNLFAEQKELSRRVGYLTRLVRAQELITGLYREELVRQRGPLRVRGGRKR